MSPKLSRLLLRLEQLEQRALLAGNVSVRVDAGDLWIVGDAWDNGITVEQLSAQPDGTAGDPTGLMITPDATTSINGMPKGARLAVKGVDGDLQIDMGGGTDAVFIVGNDAPQLASLTATGGEGDDSISVERLQLSGPVRVKMGDIILQKVRASDYLLELDGIKGRRSKASISDLSATGGITISGDDFDVDADGIQATGGLAHILKGVKGESKELRLANSTFGGSVSIAATDPVDASISNTQGSELRVETFDQLPEKKQKNPGIARLFVGDSTFTGGVSILRNGAMDVSLENTRAVDMFIKLDDINCSPSSIAIDESHFSGDVSIETAAAEDISVTDSSAAAAKIKLKFKPEYTRRVALHNLAADGSVTIESESGDEIAASGVRAADMFLKVDGVKGRAANVSIDNSDFSGGVHVESTGEFVYHTIKLRAVDMFIKLDGVKGERASVALSDSQFSGGVQIDSSLPAGVTVDGVTALHMDAKNKKITLEVKEGDIDVFCRVLNSTFDGPLSIESGNEIDVSVENTRAVDMFLKLDGVKGEKSRASITDSTFTGGVSIESSIPAEVAVDDVAAESLTLNFNKFEIKYNERSSASILDSTFDGAVSIESGDTIDVSVENTRAVDMFLKLHGIKGARSATSITDSSFSEGVTITSSSPNDLSISGLEAGIVSALWNEKDKVPTSARAAIVDSTVHGPLSIESNAPTDVSVQNTRAVDMFLKLDGVKGEKSRASIVDSTFTGGVSIEGAASDVSVNGVEAASLATRWWQKVVFTRAVSTSVVNTTLHGPLSIESNVAQDVSVENTRAVDMFLKLDGVKGARSRASVTSSEFSGGLSIESPAPVDMRGKQSKWENIVLKQGATASEQSSTSLTDVTVQEGISITSVGPHDLSLEGVQAVDAFVKIDFSKYFPSSSKISKSVFTGGVTIEGDATQAVSFPFSQIKYIYVKQGRSASPGRSTVSFDHTGVEEHVTIDSKAPLDVSAQQLRAVDMFLKLDGIKGERSSTRITDSEFSGGLTIESNSPQDVSAARVKVKFPTMNLTRPTTTGGPSSVSLTEVEADTVKIEGSSELAVSVSKTRAIGAFVKLHRLQRGRSAVAVTESDFKQGLSIESAAQLDVSVGQTRAVDMFLKLDGIKGERSSTRISDSQFSGGVSIDSATPMDVTTQAMRAVHLLMKMGPAARVSAPGSSIQLTDTHVSGDLSIETGDGADNLTFDRLQVTGATTVDTGAGNDRLRAVDCVFEGTVEFDGGSGNDLLEVRTSRFAKKPTLISWESISMPQGSGGAI